MTTDASRSFEVTAVVAADADSPYLSSTLAGLAAQARSPQRLLIALLGSGSAGEPAVRTLLAEHGFGPDRDNGLAPDGVAVARVGEARSFSEAVQRGLATTSPDTRWLWLLHDDSAPEPSALAELVRTVEDSPSIAVAGAKQVEWDAADELISVGASATIDGQRFTGIEDGEIDQGQHDGQEDVYAVGSAGMLIDAVLWDHLGGADSTLGPFGDGADLSRRARLAGHRVVVVPTAVVRHGRAGYYGLRAQGGHLREHAGPDPRRTFRARREAKVYSAMVHSRLPLVPLVAVVALLLGPLRALWRVATSELALAADEILAPLVALTRLPAVARARRRARATQSVSTRRLAALRVSRSQVRRQRRHRRMQATAERRAARAPSELEMAERAAVGVRRRIVFAAMLMITAALSLVTLAPVAFSGALTGGALLPVDDSFRYLWRSALAPWISAGSGHPGPPDAFQMLLGAVSAITGGPLGAPVQVSIALVLVLAMPLAAIGAWFAAGAATRAVLVRAWVAGVWAFGPALLLGLGQGRLGAVLAHVALPFVALGIARSLGLDRRDVVVSGMVGAQRATQRPASRRRPARAAKRERLAALAAVGRESGTPTAGGPAPVADSDPKTGPETDSQAFADEPPETEAEGAAPDGAAHLPDEGPHEVEASSKDTGADEGVVVTTSTHTSARPLAAGAGTRRERRGRSSDLEGLEPIQSNTATEYLPQEGQERAAVISRVSRAGSLGAAAAAGLALAVAAAGAPVLLPAGLVALLVLAIALGRRRSMPVGRGRLVLVALPALVLLGPLWTRAIATWDEGGWRLLFADPGVPLAAEAGPAWLTLLGWPGQPPLTGEQALAGGALGQWLLLAATATVALGAVFGLVRSGGRGRTARIGWLVAAIGLGTALASSRTVVAVGRGTGENSGTDEIITGWAGPGTSVLLLGLLLATVSALDGLRGTLTGRAFGWRQLSAAALTVLVVLGLGSSAVSWTTGVIAERHSQADEAVLIGARGPDPVPALGRSVQAPGQQARVLALSATENAVDAQLWRGQGPQLTETATVLGLDQAGAALDGQPEADPVDEHLADLVADLSTGSIDDAAGRLTQHAVAVVIVPPADSQATGVVNTDEAARSRLIAELDSVLGLDRVTENTAGVIWRVRGGEGATDDSIARARLLDGDGQLLRTTPSVGTAVHTGIDAEGTDRTLVLAERADAAWRGELGGRPLRATEIDGQQAFMIPDDAHGLLTVDYQPSVHLPWRVATVIILVLTALLALPTRRRRGEEG